MAGVLEILQQMKQMLENRGPDFKLADLFKPFPKVYVTNFCGQRVAQQVEAMRKACHEFPSELRVHEDSGLMWDTPLLSVRTKLQAQFEAGQSGVATDQIRELKEGVARYMLKEHCLPSILKWQTMTPMGQDSVRALFYAMNGVLREFLFEVFIGLGGTKKVAAASAGDSARPKTPNQDAGEDPGAFLDALVDHLGYLSAGETEDIQIVDPTKKRTYGVVHIEATEEDLVESLYQGVAKSVAIIETNEAHGVYGDEPKAAWVVLTSLKVVLGLRVTARSLTPGNMDLDIKVAGPYGFYDPLPAAKSSLSCDAEAALTLLANYVTPEMLDAPLQKWRAPYEKSKEPKSSQDDMTGPSKR